MKLLLVLAMLGHGLAGPQHPPLSNSLYQKFPQGDKGSEGYIGNGTPARDGLLPYVVSLQLTSHFCGGTIIADKWILTAAQCVAGLKASDLNIRYNTRYHNSGGSFVKAAEIYQHERYNASNFDDDIALIKLTTAINLTGQINAAAAPLPPENWDPGSAFTARVSGWGITSEASGSISSALHYVDVPFVVRRTCESAHGRIYITYDMICAGYIYNYNWGACQSDTGGPVISKGYVAGIISWNSGCGEYHSPGVNTRVGAYIGWIKSKGFPAKH